MASPLETLPFFTTMESIGAPWDCLQQPTFTDAELFEQYDDVHSNVNSDTSLQQWNDISPLPSPTSCSPTTSSSSLDDDQNSGPQIGWCSVKPKDLQSSTNHQYDCDQLLHPADPTIDYTTSSQSHRPNILTSPSDSCCSHAAQHKVLRVERRREQNRASQRKFRERKATKLREAQDREYFLQLRYNDLQQQFDELYREYTSVVSRLASTE